MNDFPHQDGDGDSAHVEHVEVGIPVQSFGVRPSYGQGGIAVATGKGVFLVLVLEKQGKQRRQAPLIMLYYCPALYEQYMAN